MKVSFVGVLRWMPDDAPAVVLGSAVDLSEYSFFQRGTIKEFMTFTGKTVVRKTQMGARQTVKAQSYMCHVVVRENQLAGVVFCDEEYPSRAAMTVAMQVVSDFEATGPSAWRAADSDVVLANPICESALTKYQDPAQADKLTRVQRELDKTKAILHETIESVLDRGEKLDDLVNKSEALSYASKQFYKSAKKTNSCWGCSLN